jgi:hypothetical protein
MVMVVVPVSGRVLVIVRVPVDVLVSMIVAVVMMRMAVVVRMIMAVPMFEYGLDAGRNRDLAHRLRIELPAEEKHQERPEEREQRNQPDLV